MRTNRKPRYLVVASGMNSISHKRNSLISVLATAGFDLPPKAELSAFGCQHCGTVFAAHKDSEPYCVTCGSEEVAADVDNDLPAEELKEDQELCAIVCTSCQSNNILSDEVAAKLGGKMHCVTCGENIEFDAPVGTDESLPEVNPVDGPEGELDLEESNSQSDETGGDDLAPAQKADDSNTSVPLSEEVQPEAEQIEVSVDELVPDDDLDFAADDETMVASVNNVNLAILAKADAGEFTNVWGKQSFVKAINASIAQVGRKQALANFGFKVLTLSFPLKAEVDKRVAAALLEEKKKVEASISGLREDYQQCLAIAAAGLNKGWFKGKENALKSGLCDELIAAGIKNAPKLVDRVFASNGAAFLATMLEIAEENMVKSVEARNELAETIDTTNYLPAEETDDTEEATATEAHLESHAGLRITKQTEVASIRDLKGGRRLFGTGSL